MYELPRRFLDARDHAFVSKLTEANAAEIKVAHIATLSSALETATNNPRLEFRRKSRAYFG